jgi:hypothetical protein
VSTYLEEYGIKIRKVDDTLKKEMPIETVVAFNRANIKRLKTSRTTLRKMSNSEHASQAFREIVIERLKNGKGRGEGHMRKKKKYCQVPMVSVLK